MERLTWEQITEKYPCHFVGLNNVIRDDEGNVESAELIYAYTIAEYPEGTPETDLVIFTTPFPLAMPCVPPSDETFELLDITKLEHL